MKTFLQIISFFCFLNIVSGQTTSEYSIISSNLGSSGSSQSVTNSYGTYKVSQSIGQSSVIGTYQSNGYYLRQGYQQPLARINTVNNIDYNLQAKVYPNPFSHQITITFSTSIKDNITILLYDVTGKVIYSKNYTATQVIDVELDKIQSGTYFLKVSSSQKRFNTKLIKI